MIITCRTLAGQKFTVTGELSDTVKALKESIAKEKGDAFPVDQQRLIFSGKVMSDEQTLEQYGVNESGFVVVMATKPKPAAAQAPGDASQAATAKPEAPAAKPEAATAKPEAATAKPEAASTTPTPPAKAEPAKADEKQQEEQQQQQPTVERENTLVHGEEYELAVANLVNMGFQRERVELAMRASFNNPDRAAEYLLSGDIPRVASGAAIGESEQQQQQQHQATEQGEGGSFIDQLRQWPQFQMLRQLVARDQSVLPTLLQQIGQSNPQLLQEIQANQEDFLRFLNEAPEEGESDAPAGQQQQQQQPQQQQQQQPRQTLLRVTAEERAAIDRLKDLGFPEHMVIEAYFACDKNEDAAANFLLNEGFDEET